MGEENVAPMDGKYVNIKDEHVQAHETGHLFSFPDEYYDQGGAVHKQYINVETNQSIKLALAQNNSNKDTWQGTTNENVMGVGVYQKVSKTPPYYLYRIRDWFQNETGREWKVI